MLSPLLMREALSAELVPEMRELDLQALDHARMAEFCRKTYASLRGRSDEYQRRDRESEAKHMELEDRRSSLVRRLSLALE